MATNYGRWDLSGPDELHQYSEFYRSSVVFNDVNTGATVDWDNTFSAPITAFAAFVYDSDGTKLLDSVSADPDIVVAQAGVAAAGEISYKIKSNRITAAAGTTYRHDVWALTAAGQGVVIAKGDVTIRASSGDPSTAAP